MAFTLNDLVRWANGSTTRRKPVLQWKSQSSPTITQGTRSFKKGTLYQLRVDNVPESYSLIYCAKDYERPVDWSRVKAAGDKSCHAYTDYNVNLDRSLSNTYSSVFYVICRYEDWNKDILPGPEGVESSINPLIIKELWETVAEIGNNIDNGEVGYCAEDGNLYSMFDGEVRQIGNLYTQIEFPANDLMVVKTYDTYNALLAAENDISEVEAYELASISLDNTDGHEGEIYCHVPVSVEEGTYEWRLVGQFNTKEYFQDTRELYRETAAAAAQAHRDAETLSLTKDNVADLKAFFSTFSPEQIKTIMDYFERAAADTATTVGTATDSATSALSEAKAEALEAIQTKIDEFEPSGVQYVVVPVQDADGNLAWELMTKAEADELDLPTTSLKDIKEDIAEIREELDTKFGNAKVAENKLYFYASKESSDSDDICGPIEGIGGGGGGAGGGGAGGNNAVLTVNNRTGWSTATIADGSACTVSFVWSSIEEGFDTGPGTLSIKVNGVTYVAAASIQNGATITRDISDYLTAGQKNKVVLTVADCYGNERTLRFTVQVIALKVTSTFDFTEPRSQAFDFRVTPTGDAGKVMHYVLDADYGTLLANLSNLNNKYKLVGKKPVAEEGVTYYSLNEDGTYSVVTTLRPGVSLAAGYYVMDPITYTQCGEEEVAELGVQYYELIDGGYIALERVIIGSPVNEYFTQDPITYTLLVEEDSIAEEGVVYYELLDNTYYVPVEVVAGETVVSDYYVDLYDFGGVDLNTYTVTADGRTITLPGYQTTSNGTALTQKIPEQTHGAHTLDVWFESVIESSKVASNLLHYEFAYLEEGHTEPILITQFYDTEIEQYETIRIPYIVITPDSETTALVNVYVNDLVEPGSEVYTDPSATLYNVNRAINNFAYRADKVVEIGSGEDIVRENGRVQIRFVIGDNLLVKDYEIVVTPCSIVVEAVKENLDFYLTSNCGKSNNSEGFNDWSYNGIAAQFSGFTWTSDGWQQDAQGYPVMRLLADARITIPFKPFEVDFGSSGETIEVEFSTSNIYNYDTPIISCWDEASQRGFKVTSQRFIFKTQLGQISTQFKEDEHVRVSFVIDEKRGDRIIGCYINGIMSGAIQYPASNNFAQTNPQNIIIGCDDATVDIYNIRFFNRSLTRNEVVTNWIADTFDGYTRKFRYEHNDIFDNGFITPETLPPDLPYMIISPIDGVSTFEEGMPKKKGDEKQIHGEYYDLQHPEYGFEFNSLIDVQGSSSQFYPRKNYEIKLKKATTPYVKYFEKDAPESKPKYKLRGNSVATNKFTFKADYASSEGANNVELTKLYNDLQKNIIWKTPRQQDAYDKGDSTDYRIGIDGYPMAVFYRVGSDTKFIGKYNFNNSKGTPEVYGFDYYEDENNATGYPIESWETLNNVSNRVIWKDDNFEGTDWANDFEARYMDEVPSYKKTSDTAPVEGKQYFYQDSSTKLFVKYGYVWNNSQMKFIPQGSQRPSAAEMANLYEPIIVDDEQAVEVNTNVTAISALATWLKSVDTGYVLNSAMKPTTTPSYAVSMDFREKEVADGVNVCGLYVYDNDKMVLVGQTHQFMNDPTALYAEFDESTGTYRSVDKQLGDDVTGLYLISGSEYILQSATDSLAQEGNKYYELVEDEYVEVEDVEAGVTVVNDYYIGYVGTHERVLITNAMALKEDGVTYYEAYNFHGVEFDEPITINYFTYQYDSANTGDYNKIPASDTFTEDCVEYRQAKFKAEFEEHFHKSTTLFYYLFTEIFLMVDSRAKNAFVTTWDGQHWSWVPYDMDTAIGINNEGALEFNYDLEDYMYVGTDGEGIVVPTANSANVYNGAESVLWRNIRDCFYEELAMLYKNLRNGVTVGTGAEAEKYVLSYDEIERRFENHQAKWPEALVNEDSYFKYIEPLLYNAEDYLEMLQGLKAEQRKWWLFNRFRYMDSKYFAADAKDNTITFRSYNAGTFQITPYADIYARVRNGNYIVSARAPRNVVTSLHAGTEINNDLETAIYSADQLKSVGDLSLFAPGWCNISMATRLQELKVGGGIDNGNFSQLTLGNNTLLRKIIATHLPNLNTSINAKGCISLEEAYFEASGITELQLPDGGILKTLHLPDTIARLEILNQTHITDFEVSSASNNANVYRNISDLIIDNASNAVYDQLDEMISQMAPLSRVRLLNTPLHFEGTTTEECWANFEAFIDSLSGMQGIDSSGNTADHAVVTGDVLFDTVVPSTFFTVADENNKYISMTDEGAKETAYVGLGDYSDFRFKYKRAQDIITWNYNNGSTSDVHTDVYHTWVGEEANWAKTPISAITPTTDAPDTTVPTRTSTSNHVEEGDVVDYAFEFTGWTREEVAEDNVNGKNTYIVRGEEEVIEVETGDSFPVVKDETFTATYKAHPIYYVNFYDRAQRSTGAETGASDARLPIHVEEGLIRPTFFQDPEYPDRNKVAFILNLKEVSIYDGTNGQDIADHLAFISAENSGGNGLWNLAKYRPSDETLYVSYLDAWYTTQTNLFLAYLRSTEDSSFLHRTVYTYEKSYVDGTYSTERLGEVPSITVPVADPTDWRTNFNDNTIGQDEFERVQDYQYYFKGWTRNANTTIYNYGEDTPEDFFADGEELTVEGNTNFYAVYEKHAIYYADFYDVVGDTGNKLLYTTCMIDGVDGESIVAYGGVTALTKAYNDHNHEHGDSVFGYTYYFDGFKEGKEKFIYDLHEGRVESEAEGTRTATLDIDGTVGVIHENKKFYTVYEARQTYYIAFFNDGVFMHEDKNVLGFESYTYTGSGTRASIDNSHVRGDAQFGYNFYHRGWNDHNSDLTYDLTLTEDTTVDGRPVKSTACNEFTTTFSNLDGNRNFYEVYEAKQVYYLNFKSWNGEAYLGSEKSFEIGSLGNDSGIPTARVDYGTHVVDDDNSTYKFEFGGWSLTAVDSEDELVNNHTVAYPTEVTGYDYASGATNIVLNGNTFLYGMYQSRKAYYVSFHDHEGNLLSANNESILWEGTTITWNGDASALARATTNDHATDSSAVDYQYEFVGWSAEEVSYDPLTLKRGDYYSSSGKRYFKLPDTVYAEIGGVYEEYTLSVGDSFNTWNGQSMSWNSGTIVEGNYGDKGQGKYAQMSSGYAMDITMSVTIDERRVNLYVLNITLTTELNPTYSNSSVTYSAPTYYMHNAIGQGATSNIKVYATYQKRPIYYVNFYDWNDGVLSSGVGRVSIKNAFEGLTWVYSTVQTGSVFYSYAVSVPNLNYVNSNGHSIVRGTGYSHTGGATLTFEDGSTYQGYYFEGRIYRKNGDEVDLSKLVSLQIYTDRDNVDRTYKHTVTYYLAPTTEAQPYLEGGNTSTTTFDLNSASASGNCVYTRTELPANTSATPTRARTNHHEDDYTLSDMSYSFYGWKTSKFNSGDLTNAWDESDTVPSGVFAKANTLGFLSANTDFYACYTKSNIYYVDFFDHSGANTLQTKEIIRGQAVTFDGTLPTRANEENHATDSSKCDYQYEFVGWGTSTVSEFIPTWVDSTAYSVYGFGIYTVIPSDYIVYSFDFDSRTYVPSELKLEDLDTRKYGSGSGSIMWLYEVVNGEIRLYLPSGYKTRTSVAPGGNNIIYAPQATTELDPTYSGSSVTYSAPSYYMYNSIGANTTSNIQVYATYQKRPVYYVDFYDWNNSAVNTNTSITVDWGATTGGVVTYNANEPIWIPNAFFSSNVGGDMTKVGGWISHQFKLNSTYNCKIYRLPDEFGKYLYDNAITETRNTYNQGYADAQGKRYKGFALYPDSPRTWTGTAEWGVGIRMKSDLSVWGMNGNTPESCEELSGNWYDNLPSDAYYLVFQDAYTTIATHQSNWNINDTGTDHIWLRHFEGMATIPSSSYKGTKVTLDISQFTFDPYKSYLEGGNTSTTSKDMTSSSASGSCVYTRTDIPMVNVSLTRANTEHHSLSDTSANDYNYTYYGWDTAIRGTGDNASAYRSDSMASTVKAKTGTLGFVGANTSFYAVYEQKNIYYVDFYNTEVGGRTMEVNWGKCGTRDTDLIVTYTEGQPIELPVEFLRYSFGTTATYCSLTTAMAKEPNTNDVGFQRVFSNGDGRRTNTSAIVFIYKLPQNLGAYLYSVAEDHPYGKSDYNTNTYTYGGYESQKYNYKGLAIYPSDASSGTTSSSQWGVGIRKKSDLWAFGYKNSTDFSFENLDTTLKAGWEAMSEYQALEDDAYYMVVEASTNSADPCVLGWINGYWKNCIEPIYFRTSYIDHAPFRVNYNYDATAIGAPITLGSSAFVNEPFCAKGYVEGTSAGMLISNTNVVRTLGTTTEPTKTAEDLWYYEYRGWSTESNDCIVNASSSDEILSVIEKWTTDNIGVVNSNTDLYAVFEKQPKVFVDIYNEGTKLGRLNGFKHVGYNSSSAYVIHNEFNPSKADSLNHEVGNYGTDTTYTFKGYVTEQATGDEWTSSMTLIGSSGTFTVGATENTLSAPYNDGYDPTTHVLTLHAVYETAEVFYLDFFEPKVIYTDGVGTIDIDQTKPITSVGYNRSGTVVSGTVPSLLPIPSEDVYATYTREQSVKHKIKASSSLATYVDAQGIANYIKVRETLVSPVVTSNFEINYKNYTVNFYNSGDGTVDVSSPIGTVSSHYQATFTAPTGSGYVTLDQDVADMYGEFLGWTDAPWDGVSQNVISTLKCTGNMSLYAVYKNNYVGTRALVERNVTGDLQCSATSVGEYAFSDLDGLEYIDLTNATSIGAHAFENDSNLVMVDIRTSACDIDPTAFDGCYSLEEIRVPVGSLSYYQTELGSLGVTITEHAWSDSDLNGWLGGTVEDVSGLPTPSYS